MTTMLVIGNRGEKARVMAGSNAKPDREYLTVNEVASELGVTSRTVRNWIRAQRLAAKRVGGVVRILRVDLQRIIKPAV